MSNIAAIMICVVMALLSITGLWKANRFGVAMLWVLLGFMTYCLTELSISYKSLVIMLK
jgi:hypothetical protein